jgi:hypothetical protein
VPNEIGICSDFDGVEVVPEGLSDVSMYPNITAELIRRGYSDDEVTDILGANLIRAMKSMEQVNHTPPTPTSRVWAQSIVCGIGRDQITYYKQSIGNHLAT